MFLRELYTFDPDDPTKWDDTPYDLSRDSEGVVNQRDVRKPTTKLTLGQIRIARIARQHHEDSMVGRKETVAKIYGTPASEGGLI